MKYALVIYETPQELARRENEQAPAYWAAWSAFSKVLEEAGVAAGGAGLLPPATATTVFIESDGRRVQDGPFADSKEQLGGFYLIDVPDLDSALDWAARCPAPGGVIEVRPVMS